MTIQTAATSASRAPSGLFGTGYSNGTLALSLLLLPYFRKAGCIRLLRLCTVLVLSLAAIGGLAGCGTGSGYFGQPSQNYTINVIGMVTGQSGATLQHLTAVTLTVQ